MKKTLLIIFPSLLPVIGVIAVIEKRNFYYLDNQHCITVWKQFGGNCYIVPGKYRGLFSPSKNYIRTSNLNALAIVHDPASRYDYLILNNQGFPISMDTHSVSMKLYASEERQQFTDLVYGASKTILPPKKYLMIDIRENSVFMNGKKMR